MAFGGGNALSRIMKANKAWVNSKGGSAAFQQYSGGQKPQYLIIGCADSRAPVEAMMGFEPGEAFVHRNVANQVLSGDLNMSSILAFGVGVLGVSDIVVCGHTECGGIKAGTSAADCGVLEHWLRGVRDLHQVHYDELKSMDEAARIRKMVDLNVLNQCLNVASNAVVQKTYAEHKRPTIHGVVYDVGTGEIHSLEDQVKELVLPAALNTGYL